MFARTHVNKYINRKKTSLPCSYKVDFAYVLVWNISLSLIPKSFLYQFFLCLTRFDLFLSFDSQTNNILQFERVRSMNNLCYLPWSGDETKILGSEAQLSIVGPRLTRKPRAEQWQPLRKGFGSFVFPTLKKLERRLVEDPMEWCRRWELAGWRWRERLCLITFKTSGIPVANLKKSASGSCTWRKSSKPITRRM